MKMNILKAMVLLSVTAMSCNRNHKDWSLESKSNSEKEITAMAPAKDAMDNPEPQQLPNQNQLPNQHPQPPGQPVAPLIPVQKTNPEWDKKLVKTAFLKLEVKDYNLYNSGLPEIIKKNGAYIASEENNYRDGFTETTVTVKVPVIQFEALLNELNTKNCKIIERNINTDDVTTELVDTKARLETKKEMRLKYLEFLKQSKNMTEILQVQAEINSIQEEIESASAHIQALGQQAAYSTINLTYYNGNFSIYDHEPKAPFVSRLWASFKNGAGFFADMIIGLVGLWPLWMGGILLLIILRKSKPLLKFF